MIPILEFRSVRQNKEGCHGGKVQPAAANDS